MSRKKKWYFEKEISKKSENIAKREKIGKKRHMKIILKSEFVRTNPRTS